ncbi:uncharacterized protein LOC131627605 [Vicia villosa]|uniref:uncharacterized protein LOC131627605 n=1 Tax=Vicia villosa TaxID=3911 RepID=UPI00273AE799|nr:uncharacterized protein LOC131627605 [Vicia villosa]
MNCHNVYPDWCNTCAIGCHANWTWGNKDIYADNHTRPLNNESIIADIIKYYKNAIIMQKQIVDKQLREDTICWSPPKPDFVKLNIDGSCGKDNYSGCGGVIRDSRGNWICGFCKFLGTCNAFMVEAWEVFTGLNLTLTRSYTKVIVNMDAKRVRDAIMQKDNHDYTSLALIRQIHLLMAKLDVVILEYTFWEANVIADDFAKTTRVWQNGFCIFKDLPKHIANLILKDSLGLATSRVVAV